MTRQLNIPRSGGIAQRLEDLELPLLSWGVTSGTLAHDEVLETIDRYLTTHRAECEDAEPEEVLEALAANGTAVPRAPLLPAPLPDPLGRGRPADDQTAATLRAPGPDPAPRTVVGKRSAAGRRLPPARSASTLPKPRDHQ